GGEPAPLWRDAHWSRGGRPQLAGPGGDGVRQSTVSGGLGAEGRNVPDGQAKHLLAPEHLSPEWHDVGGALCPQRLHPVSPPGAVYAVQEGAPHRGPPSAGAV